MRCVDAPPLVPRIDKGAEADLAESAGAVRGGVAIEMRDGAQGQVVRLDQVVGGQLGRACGTSAQWPPIARLTRPSCARLVERRAPCRLPVRPRRPGSGRAGSASSTKRLSKATISSSGVPIPTKPEQLTSSPVADQRDGLIGGDDLSRFIPVFNRTRPPAGSPCLRAAGRSRVDVVEREPAGEQLVDRQAPLPVQARCSAACRAKVRRCRCSCP